MDIERSEYLSYFKDKAVYSKDSIETAVYEVIVLMVSNNEKKTGA